MNAIIIDTPRLVLRPWRDEDVDSFAAMFDDPAVMEFLPAQRDRAHIDAIVGRVRAHFDAHGFGWWAAELKRTGLRGTGAFIGFVGLSRVPFEAHFTPAVEVGWRMASAYWGKGYATEGARAAMHAGFTQLGLDEIVSFTVPANARSWGVMERVAMTHDPADDFDHPACRKATRCGATCSIASAAHAGKRRAGSAELLLAAPPQFSGTILVGCSSRL